MKKQFAQGIDKIFQTSENKKSNPKIEAKQEIRSTFIIQKDLLAKLKAIAYWERILLKEIFNEAINSHIQKYEKKHGFIKPIKK